MYQHRALALELQSRFSIGRYFGTKLLEVRRIDVAAAEFDALLPKAIRGLRKKVFGSQ
jgi:hypothetical protein